MNFHDGLYKKQQCEETIYNENTLSLTRLKTADKDNAGVDEHQHQHYMTVREETFYSLHLYAKRFAASVSCFLNL